MWVAVQVIDDPGAKVAGSVTVDSPTVQPVMVAEGSTRVTFVSVVFPVLVNLIANVPVWPAAVGAVPTTTFEELIEGDRGIVTMRVPSTGVVCSESPVATLV